MWVAERLGAEIISADARAIYRGLVIGTDRPPPELLGRVPHHLIGILDPAERYDAAAFRSDCERLIGEILGRGRVPMVVGGSTLYIRALTRGLFPAPRVDRALRARLAALPTDELYHRLRKIDPAAAERIHPHDRVRIVRALEVYELTGRPISEQWGGERPLPWPLVKVGLTASREELYSRIERRVDEMFARGLVEEARRLWELGLPDDLPAMRTIGYRELFPYFEGRRSLGEARRLIIAHTKAYARRQLAFFRGEPGVHWIDVGGREVAEVGAEIISIFTGQAP